MIHLIFFLLPWMVLSLPAWALSDAHKAALKKLAVALPKDQIYYHWSKKKVIDNLLHTESDGTLRRDIFEKYIQLTHTHDHHRLVAGGGLYVSDQLYGSSEYGDAAIELVVPAGTPFLDVEKVEVQELVEKIAKEEKRTEYEILVDVYAWASGMVVKFNSDNRENQEKYPYQWLVVKTPQVLIKKPSGNGVPLANLKEQRSLIEPEALPFYDDLLSRLERENEKKERLEILRKVKDRCPPSHLPSIIPALKDTMVVPFIQDGLQVVERLEKKLEKGKISKMKKGFLPPIERKSAEPAVPRIQHPTKTINLKLGF